MKTTQLYQQITDQIIAAIESGKANQSWRMPWLALLSQESLRLANNSVYRF